MNKNPQYFAVRICLFNHFRRGQKLVYNFPLGTIFWPIFLVGGAHRGLREGGFLNKPWIVSKRWTLLIGGHLSFRKRKSTNCRPNITLRQIIEDDTGLSGNYLATAMSDREKLRKGLCVLHLTKASSTSKFFPMVSANWRMESLKNV